jgi:hypothetical protein
LAYLFRDVAANGLNRLNRIRLIELTCVRGYSFLGRNAARGHTAGREKV